VTYESASGQVTVTSQHYYYYYYYYVPYNTIVIFLQRKSRRDKSPYTYHVMVAGLWYVGEVVDSKLNVLTARRSDQPRTASCPVAGLLSSSSRQVASSASHEHPTSVTPVAAFSWCSGDCAYNALHDQAAK